MNQQTIVVRRGEAEALAGPGGEMRFIAGAADTGGAWSLMENIVPRDTGAPPHFHAWGEAYYLVSGEVEFDIAGDKTLVGSGDFLFAPGGTPHSFRGASDEPARMLIFDIPAHAEDFFRESHREFQQPAPSLEKLFAIGAAHGVHFVPPTAP
jgi:mannose-6-phosphate isomerase-like protein (cupin superfamily)